MARIITACTKEVRLALVALERNQGLNVHAVEINRLENEADRVHQQAVRALRPGGHLILEGNHFYGTTGYNDIIDYTGGRRPGDPRGRPGCRRAGRIRERTRQPHRNN